jgi:hypothetical protein
VQPEEQLRVPVRGLRELTASVQSPRRCQVVRRGTGAAVHTGSMMASPMALKGAEEEKGSLHMGRGSFYSRQKKLAKAARAAAGAVAVVKLGVAERRWPWSKCGRHSGAIVRTGWLTGGPQRFQIFSNLSKTVSNLKIQMA